LELTCTALAVNTATVCPAATVTLEGTVSDPLLLDSGTANPPVSAAELRVTVQGVFPGVLIVRLVQFTLLRLGPPVIVPDPPVAAICAPAAVEATAPVS